MPSGFQPLRGTPPAVSAFSYSYRKGLTKNLDLRPDAQVVVAVKGKRVSVIVPATEANLVLAKKAIAPRRDKVGFPLAEVPGQRKTASGSRPVPLPRMCEHLREVLSHNGPLTLEQSLQVVPAEPDGCGAAVIVV
jgi:hypothetical protein